MREDINGIGSTDRTGRTDRGDRTEGRGARRPGVVGGVLVSCAALVAAGVVGAVPAAAAGGVRADEAYSFTYLDHVIPPGEGSVAVLKPDLLRGTPDGTLVYALSKAPLTDASWAKGGVPAGMAVKTGDGCTASPSVKGVYLCPVSEDNGYVGPAIAAAESVKDMTRLHFGVAYAPRGSSIAKAVKAAQVSGRSPVKGTVEAHSVTVLTAEHVKKNKTTLTLPDVPAGGSVTHTVSVHAIDKGVLSLGFGPHTGFRPWDPDELKVELVSVRAGAGATDCVVHRGELTWEGFVCNVRPGDVKITYRLTANAKSPAWKIDAVTNYNVYTSGWGDAGSNGTFGVRGGTPVHERYQLLRRDTAGKLKAHIGTGRAAHPFERADEMGDEWGKYTALAKLAPLTVQGTGGPVVARDAAGVLWNFDFSDPEHGGGFWDPKKVGGGWNAYDLLAGAGDLTGDGKADLVARDKAGVLWLYRGTGVPKAPFEPRAKLAGSWKGYDALVGGSDLTGDGRADLLARDASGAVWLLKGTGRAAAPFAPRVKAATGWSAYGALVVPGDLTSDGRPDAVAVDGTGAVWLMKGTGRTGAPFAARVKIDSGWAKGDLVF
ncbi:FG-GAP repeat domain-containing protein [Streptomyces sp. NPDC093225]|uniref:FG-GAP repeat domain-containing protein n=1 Tax=Streptomyces sp. NPDC093225 TaxID=3366034 RepID=UPI0038254343